MESRSNMLSSNSPTAPQPSNESNTMQKSTLENHYHVTTVESFLKTLYGDTKAQTIINEMSDSLKNGIINGSHVISALENFPRHKVYSEEEIKEMKATDKEARNKFSIDRALLRNLFIRQAILKTPPRYPGLDLIIPSS